MSKEQIEEMAKDLCDKQTNVAVVIVSIDDEGKPRLARSARYLKNLIDAGWHKRIEGEWKQTEEPMGWHDIDCVECSACGESWVLDDNLDFDLIVEYWHYCPNCGAKMKGGAE
jgi:hypothetical protein